MFTFRDRATIVPTLKSPSLAGLSSGSLNAAVVAVAGTFFTEAIDVGTYVELVAFLQVAAHSGTNPTLDIKFQLSPDAKQWIDAGDAFVQVTTTDGLTLKKLTANFARYIRAAVTLGGTNPSYTLSLTVHAKA